MKLKALTAAVLAAALLSACGSSAASSAAPAADTSSETAASADNSGDLLAQIQQRGEIVFGTEAPGPPGPTMTKTTSWLASTLKLPRRLPKSLA